MSFVLFFRGMLAALAVFAVTIYFLSGSLWTALWQTALCAILVQVGYFVGILFMVWREGEKASMPREDAPGLGHSDDPAVDAGGGISGVPFTKTNVPFTKNS